MKSTISRYIVLLLTCLVGLPMAEAQRITPSDDNTALNSVNSVDPHAFALFQQLDATYKAMQSFSVEFDEGITDAHDNPTVSYHCQLAFRRPDHLAFAVARTSGPFREPSKVITNGKHAYLMLANTPQTATEITALSDTKSPFDIVARIPHTMGVDWLESLLVGKGLSTEHPGGDLQALSAKQEKLADGTPVETLTAQWGSVGQEPKDWSLYTYAIGLRDHLLHQVTVRPGHGWANRIVRFQYSHPDTNLPDSVFELPTGTVRLSLLHALSTKEPIITYDKGSRDGVALNDVLVAYVDKRFWIGHGQLRVTKVNKEYCEAEILSLSGGGISPGTGAIIVEHRTKPSSTKRKPDTNSWLWSVGKR